MRIYFGPENEVIIHDAERKLLYRASSDEYALEAGELRPELPEGMVAMEYRAEGVLVYYDAKQNAYPMEGTVKRPELDAVLDKSAALTGVQKVREAQTLAIAMDQAFNAARAAARTWMPVFTIG